MPRIKASPKKCVKTSNSQNPSNTWVFLLKGDGLDVPEGYSGSGTPDVVQLRHPQSGSPAMFLFSPGDGMVQEVLTFSENRRSWFIEDTVKSDGKMHLSTPIDPIFLVLPYLRKTTQAIPLDQLLVDSDFPDTSRLVRATGLKALNQVADRRGPEELMAFQYNDEKTLVWLGRKVQRVAEALKQKGVDVGGGATAATFVKSGRDTGAEESYVRYAHGIVSEYLTEDLSTKLRTHLGLPAEERSDNKRKLAAATTNHSEPAKRTKTDESVLDLTKPEKAAKPTTISSKEKARAKAAAGTKSISSFFKKK